MGSSTPHAPEWDAEIDIAERLAIIPPHVTTKGLFFSALADQIEAAGRPRPPGRWVAFSNYPVTPYVELLVDCARARFPDLPLGRALRAVGHTAYPTFVKTTVGKVIFAFAGKDPKAALRLAPRAYATVGAGTSRVTLEEGEGVDVLHMHDVYSFAEYHEVGVIEGGIREFGGEVDVKVLRVADDYVQLHVIWR
ncbi:MAG: DUF2378 family protein [Sandaracinaceae bacterium]